MTDQLTDEEHRARFMLLGYEGHNRDGRYYYRVKTASVGINRIDDTTLEPLTIEEAFDRLQERIRADDARRKLLRRT